MQARVDLVRSLGVDTLQHPYHQDFDRVCAAALAVSSLAAVSSWRLSQSLCLMRAGKQLLDLKVMGFFSERIFEALLWVGKGLSQ
jgi:hypothetical protein